MYLDRACSIGWVLDEVLDVKETAIFHELSGRINVETGATSFITSSRAWAGLT